MRNVDTLRRKCRRVSISKASDGGLLSIAPVYPKNPDERRRVLLFFGEGKARGGYRALDRTTATPCDSTASPPAFTVSNSIRSPDRQNDVVSGSLG